MKTGPRGLELITSYEGIKLTGYLLGDGKCTIGYGHAVPTSEKPNCTNWVITQKEAEDFLAKDVEKFANEISGYFTREFTQCQFDALVSFSYNVGFAYEKYTWPKDAPDSYFPGVMIQYVNPPKFRDGLTKRRKAEIALFESTDCPAPAGAAAPAPTAPSKLPSASPSTTFGKTPEVLTTPYPSISTLFSGGTGAN
jgi:GH24 family phage-related lysozyme (muramidase)